MDADIRIKKATLKDARNIAKMHSASFIQAHKKILPGDWIKDVSPELLKKRWEKHLLNRKKHIYLAVLNKKIVGLICYLQFPKIKIAEILFFYIDPQYFRKGIGRKLMTFVTEQLQEKHFKMVHLWALKNNPKSRAFYESMGARTDGTQRNTDIPIKSTKEVEYYLFLDQLPGNKDNSP